MFYHCVEETAPPSDTQTLVLIIIGKYFAINKKLKYVVMNKN